MTTPKIEAVAWMVGDEAFPSESLAIEEIRQWGPSGSIAKPVYSQQTVDALLAEVERLTYRLQVADAYAEQCDADTRQLLARAERAEAQAEAMRALIGRVVAETDWRTSSNDLWAELCKAARQDAAIGGREGKDGN